jgi:DNA replication protein DnaC
LRESRLPLEKSVEAFDWKRLPRKVATQARTLLEGAFVGRKENVLAFGNPGSGKTHLVCAHRSGADPPGIPGPVLHVGSVMLTSNLPFSQWESIFKDPMTTIAAIDRLVHHSVILELNLPSYRLEESKKQGKAQKTEARGAPGDEISP